MRIKLMIISLLNKNFNSKKFSTTIKILIISILKRRMTYIVIIISLFKMLKLRQIYLSLMTKKAVLNQYNYKHLHIIKIARNKNKR
jgi:hypothetical protein